MVIHYDLFNVLKMTAVFFDLFKVLKMTAVFFDLFKVSKILIIMTCSKLAVLNKAVQGAF